MSYACLIVAECARGNTAKAGCQLKLLAAALPGFGSDTLARLFDIFPEPLRSNSLAVCAKPDCFRSKLRSDLAAVGGTVEGPLAINRMVILSGGVRCSPWEFRRQGSVICSRSIRRSEPAFSAETRTGLSASFGDRAPTAA
jgi:hypothetical protein